MTELLHKWLARRIGLATDNSLEFIPQIARDGRIFGDILYSYNIISSDQRSQIVPTDDDEVALSNLTKYVGEWLKTIGIDFPYDTWCEVSKGKSTAIVKVLYQMYLSLQDKDVLYYTREQLRRSAVPSNNERFIVSRVPDDGPEFPKIEPNVLSRPLVVQNYTIQWHKDRLRYLKEKCKLTREKYQKYLHDKFSAPPKEEPKRISVCQPDDTIDDIEIEFASTKEQTYDELVAEETAAKETVLELDPSKAKRLMKDIARKNRQKAEERALKIRNQKILLLEMWEKLIAEQERDYDQNVSKKIVQQSQYEKQMMVKMLQTRQQKENMMEHRKAVEDEVDSEKQHEFLNALLANEMTKINQKNNYYYEKERNLELHRRLYAEKLRLKAERVYNMCLQCVKDIVDVSLRHSEFKEQFFVDPPRRTRQNWNNLFVKGQPIFDILEQPEDMVQEYLGELPEDIEEIYSLEMSRQNAMDDVDFENYCQYKWPFELEKYDLYDENKIYFIDVGANILGHIVHRLLLGKYPKPPTPPRPDLPPVNVAACINGVSDETIIPVLQRLVNLKGVKVVSLEASINFCLQAYKDETREEYEDPTLILMEETAAALKQLDNKKKPKKGLDKKGGKKNATKKVVELSSRSELDIAATSTIAAQTPRIFPGEEVILSKQAELGKTLTELASLGEPMPDDLVAAAFVQYLLSVKNNMQGWALVNFPFNIQQAACLEEALTSQPFPDIPSPEEKDETRLEDIIEPKKRERRFQEDTHEHLRKSKILPNPSAPTDEELRYKTCLTALINLKQPSDAVSDDLTELPPLSEILEPSANPLERFYTEQGCNYVFYYKAFDVPTIKHLAKLVLGEFTIPPKTSLELFGDTVLYVEQGLGDASTERSAKSKASKKAVEKTPKIKKVPNKAPETPAEDSPKSSPRGKKDKGKKGAVKVTIVLVDKETQAPEPDEEIIEIFVDEPPPPLPGEARWTYVDLPLGEQFVAILASAWENTENVYITDIKQLFFVRRTFLDAVIPYTSYVKRHMSEFIARPDNKQQCMCAFQRMFNEFDADMRDDDEVKAELHCRVKEFREKLWTICDVRREESENERRRMIGENWVTTQVCHITNNAIIMLQVELDRYVETMQLLGDYYLVSITGKPLDVYFNKITLNLIRSSSADSEEKVDQKLANPVEYMLTELDTPTTGTPFHEAIQKATNDALRIVQEIFAASLQGLQQGASVFTPTKAKQPKGKKVEEPSQDTKDKAQAILAEWKTGYDGEIERLKLRLSLLKAVAEKDLEDVFKCSQETFHGVYRDLQKRYEAEIESVAAACDLIASAIEAEMPLQPQLTLKADKFFVEPDVVLFPDELPKPEPRITEPDYEGTFKIKQLDRIVDILFDLAPNGFMIARKFTFLFQDMVILEPEDGTDPMVPSLYKKLEPKQVVYLLKMLFGNAELIDWKDFIIYHLCVKFPTEDELLRAVADYREHDPDSTEAIKDYQYFHVQLWFEDASTAEEEQRVCAIKNLLFKMYRINEDTVNYTALLLAFCKHEDPVLGVAKALELSLVRHVCWDRTFGEACVEALKNQRVLDEQERVRHEEQRKANIETAEMVVTDLIDRTVHICDSVVIEDWVSESATPIFSAETDGVDSKWLNSDMHIYSSASLVDEEQFLEVGRDVAPSPSRVYFLPFETLVTVMTVALPWHAETQNMLDQSLREHLEVIYESCRSEEFNNAVLMHEFLNNKHFLEVIQSTLKFVAKDPRKIVRELLAE